MSFTYIILLASWAVIGLGVVLLVQCTKRFAEFSIRLSNRGTATLMVLGGPLVWLVLLFSVVKHYGEKVVGFAKNLLSEWFFDKV